MSSIVVNVKENYFSETLELLKNSECCEVHFHEEPKLVLIIEGSSTNEEIKTIKKIESIKRVLSVEMVYAYSEDELDVERHNIEIAENVPNWLNDENVAAEQIKYNGDLGKKGF